MEYAWDEEYTQEDYFEDIDEAAFISEGGGCLIGIIPPLAVIFVSCFLAFFALNMTTPVVAISFSQAESTSVESDNTQKETQKEPVADPEKGSKKRLAPLFTPEVLYWEDQIISWSKKYAVDPNLVATIMQIESCGDPKATSHAGAAGLFQVMPFHFVNGENAYDPDTNARRGLGYLANVLNARQNDARLALAAYNGGLAGTSKSENLWPAETQRYTYWGSDIYKDALKGKKTSPRLQEWLNAGGASLCAQAANRLDLNP
jgi:soluble lytic murein transglycosylase-like protein